MLTMHINMLIVHMVRRPPIPVNGVAWQPCVTLWRAPHVALAQPILLLEPWCVEVSTVDGVDGVGGVSSECRVGVEWVSSWCRLTPVSRCRECRRSVEGDLDRIGALTVSTCRVCRVSKCRSVELVSMVSVVSIVSMTDQI